MTIHIAAVGKAVADGKMTHREAAQAFLAEAGRTAQTSPSTASALAEIGKGYAMLAGAEETR